MNAARRRDRTYKLENQSHLASRFFSQAYIRRQTFSCGRKRLVNRKNGQRKATHPSRLTSILSDLTRRQ